MVQLTKKILIMFVLPSMVCASEENHASKFYDSTNPIDLAVYDGEGSILVSWSISDSIVVNETRVFIKEFGQKNFEVISVVHKKTFQYLDLNCTPGTRYFYKIEVVDVNGKVYDSGSETPAFGTCKQVSKSNLFDNPIKSVHHLIIEHLYLELKNSYPYQDLRPVLDLLSPGLRSNHKWIELFPLDKLDGIRSAISILDGVINNDRLYESISNDGELYRIRPPFLPKEIAQFHTLLTESSLSATFTSEHEFLFAFNSRNKLVGGLYWKNIEKNRIHLEWVVIRKKYQRISLSKRLMSDLYKRMKHKNIEIITVGFYAEKFFFSHGFALNNSYGGLVKEL